MKFIIFFLFLFFSYNNSFANNIKCNFEEVYDDGSTQYGLLFYSNGLLRYQYENKQLFTIIYNDSYYLVRNDNRKIVNKLDDDKVLNELSKILNDYPNIKKTYMNFDTEINIEKNTNDTFIKRIAVKSNKVNLSIYLLGCKFESISKNFFHPFSFIEAN
jgi:hypothetical protein